MHAGTVVSSLLGGALIGAAATWMYAAHRRVAGVSGMFHRALLPDGQPRGLDAAFLVGIAAAGAAVRAVYPAAFGAAHPSGLAGVTLAGLLVGAGTRLANGCTSGHGVCGVSRMAPRSLAATATFMAFGIATAVAVRHAAEAAR